MNYLTSAFAMAGALFLGAACSSSETGGDDELRDPPDGPAEVESNLTTSEKNAICNAIPAPRAWTEAETLRLTNEVVTRFSALKRTNDALITKRGVGSFVGARTNAAKMLDSGDFDGLARILAPKLKAGFNANQVAHELKGTSCIGRVYAVMRESYAALGRASEWAAIEKCGRAWDSDGLHVQAALMRNGWKSPAVAWARSAFCPEVISWVRRVTVALRPAFWRLRT